MLEQMEGMFSDVSQMLKRLKKDTYESNMKEFREKHGHYFQEMVRYVQSEPDQEKAAREVGELFAEKVWNAHQKHGKIGGRTRSDLDFFMIYYIFPAILLTDSPCGKITADELCAAWKRKFKGSNISYTTYEELYNGFRTKILGIF